MIEERQECIGNCTEETIIDLIFGSVSEFARQVELNGDRFIYNDDIRVAYDEVDDIHYFWRMTHIY